MDFRELIERDGILVYKNKGDSMKPLIREGRDLVMIGQVTRKPRKYDIVLYKRDSGEYVLHRIMKICPDGYVMCGDNRWRKEYGITDEDILGVMTSVIRSNREISMDAKAPRIYARAWCALYPVRIGAKKGKQLAGRIIRKAFKR